MRAQVTRSAELVGRESELAALPEFLDAVAEGPAALVLEGDAGIGKTVLWAAGAGLAHDRGCGVLSCRPTEAEIQLPFAALGDLLDGVPEGALAGLPEPQRPLRELRAHDRRWVTFLRGENRCCSGRGGIRMPARNARRWALP